MYGYPQFRFCKKLNSLLYTLLTLSCFFINNFSFAQQREIDSLNKVLPALRGIQRIDCLNKLSEYYCNYHKGFRFYSRTDSAELCVNKAYSEAEKINYKSGEG